MAFQFCYTIGSWGFGVNEVH